MLSPLMSGVPMVAQLTSPEAEDITKQSQKPSGAVFGYRLIPNKHVVLNVPLHLFSSS